MVTWNKEAFCDFNPQLETVDTLLIVELLSTGWADHGQTPEESKTVQNSDTLCILFNVSGAVHTKRTVYIRDLEH